MFQTKLVEKIKTHLLCSVTFFRKLHHLWDNVEKYGTARQATDDNIIWRMHFACWITKATDTHRMCNTYCFPQQQWLLEHASLLRYMYAILLQLYAILLQLLLLHFVVTDYGNQTYGTGVSSCGVVFIRNFMKIGQVLQKLTWHTLACAYAFMQARRDKMAIP
jgi:hypothetical protein